MNNLLIKLTLLSLFAINFAKTSLVAESYVSSAFEVNPTKVVNSIPNEKKDNRVEALERMFQKYNSPLLPYAKDYVKLADKHGVDWRLLPSIAGLESSFGKRLMPGSHNGYGWGGGHIYFSSWEEGIDTINESLAKKYYGRGATNVWSIGPIYAESPTWAVRVNKFMLQLDRELAAIETENAPLTI